MSRVSAANHSNRSAKKVARQPGVLALLLIAGLIGAAPAPVLAGDVYAWGNNRNGELGNGKTTNSSIPIVGRGLSDVMTIASGDAHGLALKTDGTVWAWGYNVDGRLGNGTNTDSDVPVEVSGLSNVVAIKGGGAMSLALKMDGTVWAWGYNGHGELGDGNTINSNVPVAVSGLSNVTAIACGGFHSLALKNDGTVWAWGYNPSGQLGDKTTTNSSVPVQVSGLSNVMAIAGGDYHSLALKTDGTVWAWGDNSYGQLGDKTTTSRNVPVQVSGLPNVMAIAGGDFHSLALATDGSVWAWGDNWYGQLGNGKTTNSSVPVKIIGLSDVMDIAGGGFHSLALATDGTVLAWGENVYGQLGNGTNTNSSVPETVDGLSNVMAIAGGGLHSLALAPAVTFTWKGGVDNWFNSNAWTPAGVPGPGDTAVINGGDATADLAVNVAEIDLSGGTLDGTGTITVTKAFKLSNPGQLKGNGKLEIPVGAVLQFSGDFDEVINQRTVDIVGSAIWGGGGNIDLGGSAVLNNIGTFDIKTSGTFIQTDGTASINNTGTLTRSAGAGNVTIAANFNNDGSTVDESGTLVFQGDVTGSGAFQANGGVLGNSFEFLMDNVMLPSSSSISGAGNVTFVGATVADAGTYTVTGSTAVMNGSEVTFTKPFVNAAPLDVAGTATFAGGFTQNSGSTNLDGGTLTGMNSLKTAGGFTQNSRSTTRDGGTPMSTNGITIGGGSVTGSGTLNGAVTINGALSPGTPTQLGDVMVTGSLTETPNGVINIRVGAPAAARGRQSAAASDVVSVSGVAHLGGTLNVTIPAGTPAVSNLKVMSYSSHDGFFANVLGVASPNRVVVGPTDTRVTSDPAGSLAAGIQMVSVPYDFSSSGQTAMDLFQVTSLSDGTMPIATWDPTKNIYDYYPQLPGTQTQPGCGYWIELNTAKTITAVGNSVSSPFTQTLLPGWNMIGDPFPTAINVSTLQFSAGAAIGSNAANSVLSFATATAAGLVDSTLYGFSGSGYVAATTLQPYAGYWIYIDPTTSQNLPVQVTFTRGG